MTHCVGRLFWYKIHGKYGEFFVFSTFRYVESADLTKLSHSTRILKQMEIWYTLTGTVDRREVQEAISWINNEIYSKPVKRVRFLLAAGGGEVASGINLYTYLKALPVEVETIAFGAVDVAAALIFLGGSKRVVVDGCRFFFREGRYTILDHTASVRSHEQVVSVFRREQNETSYIIAKETDNDTEVVEQMLRRSKIMLSDEAIDFGLAHEHLKTLPLHQQERLGFQIRSRESDRPTRETRQHRIAAEGDENAVRNNQKNEPEARS
jgi:ATP-dependent protease ClpP protease subunit